MFTYVKNAPWNIFSTPQKMELVCLSKNNVVRWEFIIRFEGKKLAYSPIDSRDNFQ